MDTRLNFMNEHEGKQSIAPHALPLLGGGGARAARRLRIRRPRGGYGVSNRFPFSAVVTPPPKGSLGPPQVAPTRPNFALFFRFAGPLADFFRIFADLPPPKNLSKIVENRDAPKSSQNPENPAPERQKCRILPIFDVFRVVKKHAKT